MPKSVAGGRRAWGGSPQSAAVALRTPFPLLAGAPLAGALLAKQRPVHRDVPSAPGRLGPQLPRDTQSGFLPPLFHYPAPVTLTPTSFGSYRFTINKRHC